MRNNMMGMRNANQVIRKRTPPYTQHKRELVGRRGRWEGGWGWGILVNPWLIHVNV